MIIKILVELNTGNTFDDSCGICHMMEQRDGKKPTCKLFKYELEILDDEPVRCSACLRAEYPL